MPFAVTVDYETVEKDTVTVRERDTTKQVCLVGKQCFTARMLGFEASPYRSLVQGIFACYNIPFPPAMSVNNSAAPGIHGCLKLAAMPENLCLSTRHSNAQVRVPVAEVPDLLRRLSNQTETWEAVLQKYPAQAAAAE